MIAFVVIAAALAVLALGLVLRPLLKRRDGARLSRREANIAIYKDELRELDADLAAGTLARADYDRARMELEARLLEDVSLKPGSGLELQHRDAPIQDLTPGRTAALAVGIAVPPLAV